jgi:hypothetical protein
VSSVYFGQLQRLEKISSKSEILTSECRHVSRSFLAIGAAGVWIELGYAVRCYPQPVGECDCQLYGLLHYFNYNVKKVKRDMYCIIFSFLDIDFLVSQLMQIEARA